MITIKKIFEFIQKGQLSNLETLNKNGNFDPSKCILLSSKDSILHIAIRTGSTETVKWLLEHGCRIFLEHQNNDGKRPLHEAAILPNSDIVDLLLRNGVEVDPLKRADWTPLMLSTAKGYLQVIQKLVEGSASMLLRNKDGWTAFHIGCRDSSLEVIEYYLSLKEDIWDSRSNNGRTPLHTAALHGKKDIINLLLTRAKYPKNEEDSCGNTPLMDAVRSSHLDCVHLLLYQNSESLRKMDNIGRQTIHLAAEAGQDDVIHFMVKHCLVEVDSISKTGETPLHFASKENHTSTLNLLVSLGADINHQDLKGRTALWKAASAKKAESYQTLISCGAQGIADLDGKKPSNLMW